MRTKEMICPATKVALDYMPNPTLKSGVKKSEGGVKEKEGGVTKN